MPGNGLVCWKPLRSDMRVLVTGKTGQLTTAMSELARGSDGVSLTQVGRPELDLARPIDLAPLFEAHKPDVVVNAAAYTAVDQAESEPEHALAINGAAAGAVARAAHALGVPVIQISTDYVFDGSKPTAYLEADPTGPIGAYGRSKLAGEQAVAAATHDHVILRTAWVYAANGKNFVRTMLRLAATRSEVAVVADQLGCPSYAPDIAEAVLGVARNLAGMPSREKFGVFHLCGAGETDWARFAEAIFAESRARGGPSASVKHIGTVDYPTPARRPANSRLDCAKLRAGHGIAMPDWRDALRRCMDRLIVDGKVVE